MNTYTEKMRLCADWLLHCTDDELLQMRQQLSNLLSVCADASEQAFLDSTVVDDVLTSRSRLSKGLTRLRKLHRDTSHVLMDIDLEL